MKSERIQLHSELGRTQLRLGVYLFWPVFAVCMLVCLFAVLRLNASPWSLLGAVVALPFFVLTRWAAKSSGRVYATETGLELVDQARTIAWGSVAAARQVPFPNLIPIYRVTFNDGTPSLTFLARERAEQVILRFKAGLPISRAGDVVN